MSVFDNGCLRELPVESRRVMDSLMMPLLGKHSEDENRSRIVKVHDTVVERVFAVRDLRVQACGVNEPSPVNMVH